MMGSVVFREAEHWQPHCSLTVRPHVLLRMAVAPFPAAGASNGWRGYKVAPAKGLFLVKVEYPPEVSSADHVLRPRQYVT